MALTPAERSLAGWTRFGLGPRPGDLLSPAAADPRAALHAELADFDVAMIGPDTVAEAGLLGSVEGLQAVYGAAEARKALNRQQASRDLALASPAGRSEVAADAAQAWLAALKDRGGIDTRIYRAETLARLRKAAQAPIGFAERLVAFWSNHFAVSTAKGELLRATAGAFEREAIRPFVLGRFADMLAAVERHPAMLTYLDNAQSVGPDSRANGNHQRGLNENLAREVLELHTLGVDGGYSQGDVTAFARVLTGWTIAGRDARLGDPGSFVFNTATHQPGGETLLGRTYPEGGFGQGETVLADLARHPATARHLATKLVRHFIADDPPPAAVDRIAATYSRTDGNLKAVSLALIDLPDAWAMPATKLRTPYEFLIAANRLLGRIYVEPFSTLGQLRQLGMPLWEPPGPNGFADVSAAWASPEGLKLRLDFSAQMGRSLVDDRTPAVILDDAFGSAVSPDTRDVVGKAESKQQAVALILMAPEFQRR